MRKILRWFFIICVWTVLIAVAAPQSSNVDWDMIAKIREEGFQRSQVMDMAGYMSDVLGARLTLSQDMKRAQIWVKDKMEEIGLVNTLIEPFMDYGVTWDNEYFSLHMMEPDYQPLVGFPLTHTPSTPGKITCRAVISEIKTKQDLEEMTNHPIPIYLKPRKRSRFTKQKGYWLFWSAGAVDRVLSADLPGPVLKKTNGHARPA